MATNVGEAQLTRVGPKRPRPTGLAVLAPATATTWLDSLGPVQTPYSGVSSVSVGRVGQLPHAHVGTTAPVGSPNTRREGH